MAWLMRPQVIEKQENVPHGPLPNIGDGFAADI
jgi:hypothetical protein